MFTYLKFKHVFDVKIVKIIVNADICLLEFENQQQNKFALTFFLLKTRLKAFFLQNFPSLFYWVQFC